MTSDTHIPLTVDKKDQISEVEINELMEKVREFRENNQRYLVTPLLPTQTEEVSIISMANTSTSL